MIRPLHPDDRQTLPDGQGKVVIQDCVLKSFNPVEWSVVEHQQPIQSTMKRCARFLSCAAAAQRRQSTGIKDERVQIGICAAEDEIQMEDFYCDMCPDMVRMVRVDDMRAFAKHPLYNKVSPLLPQEWNEETSKDHIGTKLGDFNKGDNICPNYQAWLVAKEKMNRDLFAATPSIDVNQMLL